MLGHGMYAISLNKIFCQYVNTAAWWVFLHTERRQLNLHSWNTCHSSFHTGTKARVQNRQRCTSMTTMPSMFYISVAMWLPTQIHTHKLAACGLSFSHTAFVDLQIIMLVPLWVQRISHSICRVALSRAIHHDFGKRVWQSWKTTQGRVRRWYQVM